MHSHEFYMKRAIELAKGGWGRTNPNPLVGAVIVKDGKIISEGFHEVVGESHGEVCAIKNATSSVAGSTMYVNLEPCSHYGRTPPCVKAIIEAGIKKVVIAMIDPNPKVSGRGVNILKEAGVEVEVGVMEKEARALNEIFINYVVNKRPFVIMKTAMTLDGKIATFTGSSKWITGTEAKICAYYKNRVSAIMVGSNTVIKDNPFLTTRLEEKAGKDPVRIIVDGRGIVPEDSNVFNSHSKAPVILATTYSIDKDKEERLIEKGVKIIKTEGEHVDLELLMDELYKINIDSILLEGGGTLNSYAISSKIVDKVMFFVAPKIVGGKNAVTPVEGCGIDKMEDALEVKNLSIKRYGSDILIEGYLEK